MKICAVRLAFHGQLDIQAVIFCCLAAAGMRNLIGTIPDDFCYGTPHLICIGADDFVDPKARVFQLNFSIFVIKPSAPSLKVADQYKKI
jgi:hypothetical protein